MLSLMPRPFVQSSFDVQASRSPHVFFLFLLLFIWRCRFFRVLLFVSFPLSLCIGEYVVPSFLPNGAFLPCDHGLDVDTSLYENSINQSIMRAAAILYDVL